MTIMIKHWNDILEKEMTSRSGCNKYSHELKDWPFSNEKPVFNVSGTLSGDINWNDMDVQINIENPWKTTCNIKPFTHNCGIKTIQDLYITINMPDEVRKWLLLKLESFLFHCGNTGILIGSDTTAPEMGQTLKTIKNDGIGYHIHDAVWNPNYTWDLSHKICLFYKNLKGEDYVNDWS